MKRFLSLAFVLTIALSSSACGGGGGGSVNTAEPGANTVEGSVPVATRYPSSDKPMSLSIFGLDDVPFNNDYPVFKKAAEYTGVTLVGTIPKSMSDESQAFNTMVSFRDLADIICYYKDEFSKYALEGMLTPLNDLIDKHAPNLKKFLDSDPELVKWLTAPDGKIYCIPFVPAGDTGEAWFIRQDWLDKLNLSAPKSTEELHDILVAFKTKDPNGNGQQDEVPFFGRGKGDSVYNLSVLWNAHRSWYVKDGAVKFGSVEPEFRTAMKNIAQWYKDGLIDNEIYLRDSNARELFLGDNIGGVTHDWIASTASLNNTFSKSVPGLKFAVIPPPTGVEQSRREKYRQGAWAISVTNKDTVATIKYFDFFFTEEGRRIINFGVEGIHYDMVNGKPIIKDSIINGEKPVLNVLKEAGAQIKAGFLQDFEYERQTLNAIGQAGMDLYTNGGYMEEIPVFLRNDEEDKRYASLITAVRTYQDETFQKWVLGTESVDAGWDKYVNEMSKLKIEEMAQIQQAAYDRFYK